MFSSTLQLSVFFLIRATALVFVNASIQTINFFSFLFFSPRNDKGVLDNTVICRFVLLYISMQHSSILIPNVKLSISEHY